MYTKTKVSMELLALFVAQQIASYAIEKGLERIIKSEKRFEERLNIIILKSIKEFSRQRGTKDEGNRFAFYSSQAIVEELLKYRLFSTNGHNINIEKLKIEFEQHPNIITPSNDDLIVFFEIFNKNIKEDDFLKKLEFEEFKPQIILDIQKGIDSIQNYLEKHLVEIISLLEEEYKEEIESCLNEIRELKPRRAHKRLEEIEQRIQLKTKYVSSRVRASLKYIKGICNQALEKGTEANEAFIKAYKLEPENSEYLTKACMAYYVLKDAKFKILKQTIEETDEYNAVCWAIDTFESEDSLKFINENVVSNVLENHYFKRLIFNHNLRNSWSDRIELIESLEVFELIKILPETINYNNFHHWLFVLNILSIQFFTKYEIPFQDFVIRDAESIHLLELLGIFSDSIEKSELPDSFNVIVFNRYWLESEIDLQDSTIFNLQHAYNRLKEKDSFRTMLLANSIQKHESVDKALEVINSFEGEPEENLITIEAFCKLFKEPNDEEAIEFFKQLKQINELNLQNVCSFLVPIARLNILNRKSLLELVNEIEFSDNKYKSLILLLIDSLYKSSKTVEIEDIHKLKKELNNEEKLNFFIALLYYENTYFEDCRSFLHTYLVEEDSRDLYLYIKALNSLKSSNQLELLRLLKKWRREFSFNEHLLRIEAELQQILKDWEEIYIISKYALEYLPKDESFFTSLIISIAVTNRSAEIIDLLEEIRQFDFQRTENAIRVASILIQSNHLSYGLKIIYSKALDKNDGLARMNYLSLSMSQHESDYFKELDKVTDDCHVVLDIDGELNTIKIGQETFDSPLVKASLGKSVNETFTIQKKFSGKLRKVKVLRIMDKYLGLTADIYKEAQSSLSTLPIESLEFESKDINGIEKSLIENFGANEERRRKETQQNIQDYYGYKISLIELAISNFNASYIDGYFNLTSSFNKGYLVSPLKYLNDTISISKNKLVIDFSSGLLFYKLSEELGLKFEEFIVSKNIFNLIDEQIVQTESKSNSNMSISIYGDRIVPHFYDDKFHENRIDFLIKIRRWFEENTISEIPEEKLEYRPLYTDGKMTPLIEYMFDNVLLSRRQGHALLSDDLTYTKMKLLSGFVSTEKYLINKFPNLKNEILERMLTLRYLGISINSEVLYSAYIDQNKEDMSHVYNYALRNLTLPQNFNFSSIYISIDFLKKVAVNPSISMEKYETDALHLFAMLVLSTPNQAYYLKLSNYIKESFELLGQYQELTLRALLNALRISKLNKGTS